MLGFPADQARGVCDGGQTHQHTEHDSAAVRGAERGSAQTPAPVSESSRLQIPPGFLRT